MTPEYVKIARARTEAWKEEMHEEEIDDKINEFVDRLNENAGKTIAIRVEVKEE